MATSGTYGFDLTLQQIIEEAFDRCGLRASTGYDFESAKRSLDLLLIEWNNRGTNFWTLDEVSVALVAGTATVSLPTETFDLLEVVIRTGSGTSQVDLPVTRMSMSEYSTIPNKATQGRPVNYWVDKKVDGPDITLWPTPNQAYTLVYWRLTRIEEAGTPGDNTTDVPYRFLPPLVSGLAYKIATKRVGDPQKKAELKADYEEAWRESVAGDRDRSSLRIIPGYFAT